MRSKQHITQLNVWHKVSVHEMVAVFIHLSILSSGGLPITSSLYTVNLPVLVSIYKPYTISFGP